VTDKRLKGMEVRYGGKSLRLHAVIAATGEPDPSTLSPFAARLQKAVAGPGLRMAMAGLGLAPGFVIADIVVNTDEKPEPVLKRLRDALVGTPPGEAPWIEHGPGDNTLLSAEELDPTAATTFWEKFIAQARDDLRKRP
jgi:hypothetical protein